jgi:hypothetical protein
MMWTMTGGVAAAAMLLAMPSPTLQSEYVRKEKFLEPVVTVAGAAQDGYTTYALWLRALPGADVGTIYTIYGDSHVQMTMPPAFQADAPFGCDIGGVNPAFYTYSTAAASDSWLSVGVTGGNNNGDIASIGIDFDSWSETKPMVVSDGAVFWMDPLNAPNDPMSGGQVQVGQITTPTGTPWSAVVNAQGKNKLLAPHKDWEDRGIVFTNQPKPGVSQRARPTDSPRPPLSPSAASAAAASCSGEMVSSTFQSLPAACCAEEDDCVNGFPSQCSSDCAALVMPFWHACETFMGSIPGYAVMDGMWQNFVSECRSGTPVTDFSCTYTELLPIALECSSAEMDTEDFCSSDCAMQLLPMVQQCGAQAAFEEAIQLLVGRPVGKIVSNCVSELSGPSAGASRGSPGH